MKIIVKTVFWKQGKLKILDQTQLPSKIVYINCSRAEQIFDAIKKLKVRGAPAIGVAAAWGIYVGIKNSKAKTFFLRISNLSTF